MKTIIKRMHKRIIDDFQLKMVREIDIKRTKFENIPTYGGNRAHPQGAGLVRRNYRKNKKPISMEELFLDELIRQKDKYDVKSLYSCFIVWTIYELEYLILCEIVFYKNIVLFVLKW